LDLNAISRDVLSPAMDFMKAPWTWFLLEGHEIRHPTFSVLIAASPKAGLDARIEPLCSVSWEFKIAWMGGLNGKVFETDGSLEIA
jgi:hypothetical protein